MKTIKNTITAIAIILLGILPACTQNETGTTSGSPAATSASVDSLQMENDSIYARILREVEAQIILEKAKMTAEALTSVAETRAILYDIANGNVDEAIEKGKKLIGNFEILMEKDPSIALLPVDVDYRKNELITDLETVRSEIKLAEDAMDDGYYQLAGDILANLKSEIIISTYYIPTATYPEAIKAATIALENSDTTGAQLILFNVLNTVVIEETVLPLPVMKAEQMILEAASIDAAGHENADKVLNLLDHAAYQLTLAEELGYGKRDKEYEHLADLIKELKKSVKKKQDSSVKFDELKEVVKTFKKKLTGKPVNNK